VDGGMYDRPSVCGLLNASFMLWLEHYLNAHCRTVFPFYLVDKRVHIEWDRVVLLDL